MVAFGLTITSIPPLAYSAGVESRLLRTIPLGAQPLDVTSSADGKWIYILLQGGEVLVHSANGDPKGRFRVREDAERIVSAPTGEQVWVMSREQKALDLVSVELIQEIDITDSPFKGPADAPIAVVVYSDFQ